MKSTAALLAGISLLSFAAGCTADAADESVAQDQDLVAPMPIRSGSFDLFQTPRYEPQSMCEMVTKLELNDTNAHLEDHFVGPCPTLAIHDPNPRDYKLVRVGSSCGSSFYEASFKKGIETHSLKLTDHRTRVCRDIVPAQIIVEETIDGEMGPQTFKLYSQDVKPTETLEGELVSVMAIGGETTGTSLQTQSGLVELILDNAERAQFEDGKRARVKGKKTTLTGVETGVRPAFEVSDILVCPNPGWVNCMPGPGVVRPYCTNENRTWIHANCEGVDFAD